MPRGSRSRTSRMAPPASRAPQMRAAPRPAPVAQPPAAAPPSAVGSSAIKQFLECAQNQGDIKLCEGFSEVLKQCRLANGLA
uniref:CHCH domain-containing protein n=1 Tax=Colobus angolensis palliatus TaxID=336983 RepID=A0A2K5HYC7_COLAP